MSSSQPSPVSGTPEYAGEDPAAPSAESVDSRANLLPEEEAAGSDDPHRQAEVILEESAERVLGTGEPRIAREHRTSADTVEPVENG
jgi:hypothetical protein